MKLTTQTVKHARPGRRYGDGAGLYLQVTRDGVRSWIFRYERAGRERWLGLGPLRDVTLAEAREAARDARRLLRDGADPIGARRQRHAMLGVTFQQAAERLAAAQSPGWRSAKHAKEWTSSLRRLVYPQIGDLPVAAIDTAAVLRVLEPIWNMDAGRRVRQRIEQVLDWAKAHGLRDGDNPARLKGHLRNLLPARSKLANHHAALPWSEAPAFVAELRKREGIPARALELTILTALRTSEVIGARWEEIDLDSAVWTIPAARMKGARAHRVPLSARAMSILRALPSEGAWVFPGTRRGQPIGPLAMWNVLKDTGHAELTVHGFRSTFRDWAAEATAYPNHVCEQALAHAIAGAVEAAYRRGDLFEKRQRLMEDWAAYCISPPTRTGEVTPIRNRRHG